MICDQKGFSLIEVLIAFALLTIGVLGLVKLQVTMDSKSENARQSINALYLAEEKLEEFRSRAPSSAVGTILYDSIINTDERVSMAGTTVSRVIKVIDNYPVSGAKKVTVEVSWNNRWGKSQTIGLTTVISSYSEF
ncbi:prepilin-type N-terminal cleavage/methylation domain-containing protein [Vibrio sp. Of7-15]|uniref:type IV pilus modification PilV family protein n=1 Tax=Vibrio sp. Of7-15 TaxID=2724879 RepID=UPI0023B7DC0F|nr:prepilin-type N-terminal cleavage/methylation domain-containing protein [Vibrio sp. Of7-15]